jgi:hypothetical protein
VTESVVPPGFKFVSMFGSQFLQSFGADSQLCGVWLACQHHRRYSQTTVSFDVAFEVGECTAHAHEIVNQNVSLAGHNDAFKRGRAGQARPPIGARHRGAGRIHRAPAAASGAGVEGQTGVGQLVPPQGRTVSPVSLLVDTNGLQLLTTDQDFVHAAKHCEIKAWTSAVRGRR